MARERLNRMICKSCNKTFDIQEATIKYRDYAGIKLQDKKCPFCGGSFRAVELPEDLDEYLFSDNDKRYYSYPDNKRK